jgi:Protein of unknown function (DUF2798)
MHNHLPKIHPKHLAWLMPLFLSGIMSGAISCFNMIINKGFGDGFFSLWLHAWIVADGISTDPHGAAFGSSFPYAIYGQTKLNRHLEVFL